MARKSCRVFFAMAIGIALFMATNRCRQEPFYKGKTVRLLVIICRRATDVVARLVSDIWASILRILPSVQNMLRRRQCRRQPRLRVASPMLDRRSFLRRYLPQILGGAAYASI